MPFYFDFVLCGFLSMPEYEDKGNLLANWLLGSQALLIRLS